MEVRHRLTGEVIVSGDYASLRECLEVNKHMNFEYADLRHAPLRGAKLWGMKFRRANFEYADLRETVCWRTDFEEADLPFARLECADFWHARLRRANLEHALCCGTDFSYSELQWANLECAQLECSNLWHARLRGVKGYADSREIFCEVMRHIKPRALSKTEWAIVAQILVRRLCWREIVKKFGKKVEPILHILKEHGFEEWEERYKRTKEAMNHEG